MKLKKILILSAVASSTTLVPTLLVACGNTDDSKGEKPSPDPGNPGDGDKPGTGGKDGETPEPIKPTTPETGTENPKPDDGDKDPNTEPEKPTTPEVSDDEKIIASLNEYADEISKDGNFLTVQSDLTPEQIKIIYSSFEGGKNYNPKYGEQVFITSKNGSLEIQNSAKDPSERGIVIAKLTNPEAFVAKGYEAVGFKKSKVLANKVEGKFKFFPFAPASFDKTTRVLTVEYQLVYKQSEDVTFYSKVISSQITLPELPTESGTDGEKPGTTNPDPATPTVSEDDKVLSALNEYADQIQGDSTFFNVRTDLTQDQIRNIYASFQGGSEFNSRFGEQVMISQNSTSVELKSNNTRREHSVEFASVRDLATFLEKGYQINGIKNGATVTTGKMEGRYKRNSYAGATFDKASRLLTFKFQLVKIFNGAAFYSKEITFSLTLPEFVVPTLTPEQEAKLAELKAQATKLLEGITDQTVKTEFQTKITAAVDPTAAQDIIVSINRAIKKQELNAKIAEAKTEIANLTLPDGIKAKFDASIEKQTSATTIAPIIADAKQYEVQNKLYLSKLEEVQPEISASVVGKFFNDVNEKFTKIKESYAKLVDFKKPKSTQFDAIFGQFTRLNEEIAVGKESLKLQNKLFELNLPNVVLNKLYQDKFLPAVNTQEEEKVLANAQTYVDAYQGLNDAYAKSLELLKNPLLNEALGLTANQESFKIRNSIYDNPEKAFNLEDVKDAGVRLGQLNATLEANIKENEPKAGQSTPDAEGNITFDGKKYLNIDNILGTGYSMLGQQIGFKDDLAQPVNVYIPPKYNSLTVYFPINVEMNVYAPDVTNIGDYVFSYTRLMNIYAPKLQIIGTDAFKNTPYDGKTAQEIANSSANTGNSEEVVVPQPEVGSSDSSTSSGSSTDATTTPAQPESGTDENTSTTPETTQPSEGSDSTTSTPGDTNANNPSQPESGTEGTTSGSGETDTTPVQPQPGTEENTSVAPETTQPETANSDEPTPPQPAGPSITPEETNSTEEASKFANAFVLGDNNGEKPVFEDVKKHFLSKSGKKTEKENFLQFYKRSQTFAVFGSGGKDGNIEYLFKLKDGIEISEIKLYKNKFIEGNVIMNVENKSFTITYIIVSEGKKYTQTITLEN
ncbi:hypothetical protein H9M94_02725 [Mycoplasma sp. Pen4]|uniref:hypothetical protein n=1 Tax=Mycoplasma sp. Pen4 TaxID=640330 RepID=UPI001654673C|nr:hypothetical protein [Mycoplasma sp. Pen4]QNM93500.1 hypothetical protein H9M94_02725 [Mycoplasma sp. Pen4]